MDNGDLIVGIYSVIVIIIGDVNNAAMNVPVQLLLPNVYNVNYKIIFNGSPKKFLSIAEKNNFIIDTEKQIWKVK